MFRGSKHQPAKIVYERFLRINELILVKEFVVLIFSNVHFINHGSHVLRRGLRPLPGCGGWTANTSQESNPLDELDDFGVVRLSDAIHSSEERITFYSKPRHIT